MCYRLTKADCLTKTLMMTYLIYQGRICLERVDSTARQVPWFISWNHCNVERRMNWRKTPTALYWHSCHSSPGKTKLCVPTTTCLTFNAMGVYFDHGLCECVLCCTCADWDEAQGEGRGVSQLDRHIDIGHWGADHHWGVQMGEVPVGREGMQILHTTIYHQIQQKHED